MITRLVECCNARIAQHEDAPCGNVERYCKLLTNIITAEPIIGDLVPFFVIHGDGIARIGYVELVIERIERYAFGIANVRKRSGCRHGIALFIVNGDKADAAYGSVDPAVAGIERKAAHVAALRWKRSTRADEMSVFVIDVRYAGAGINAPVERMNITGPPKGKFGKFPLVDTRLPLRSYTLIDAVIAPFGKNKSSET